MQKTVLILAFFLLASISFGQKLLQLERLNSTKTRKYYPGDEITFQLNNGQWYTRVIDDVSYEKQFILFANGHVAVDSIVAFRSFKPARWSRSIGNQLFNFAAAWVLFSVVDQAVADDPFQDIPKSAYVIPASSIATGILVKKLFKHRTFRIRRDKSGEVTKWRLRTLDLTVK
ncbi:MAG: hypothetical protein GC192_11480 [Bacteroidetes bacterium]|nr:hypothetical protein [Bacteroidota bacterium]